MVSHRVLLIATVFLSSVCVSARAQGVAHDVAGAGREGLASVGATDVPSAGSPLPADDRAVEAADVVEGVAPAPQAPRLLSIEFLDRVYFREETLRSFLRSRVGEPVDLAALDTDRATLVDQYRSRGFLRADVELDVVDVDARATPGGRGVIARFIVRAGERAELKAVHVVGNELVDEEALKEGFFSRPPEPLGALTRAGLFHRPFLDQDQQRLVYNYYKRGFLEARVVDTRVTASSDLSGIEVTLSVIEGPQYELGGLTFAGEIPEDTTAAALRARVATRDGAVADLVTLMQQADPVLDAWRERGHPFARFEQQMAIVPPPSRDTSKKGIALTLNIVRGPAAVVRAVRVTGNKGTMEHVLRREIVVETGALYDHKKVKESEKLLMQTGILQAAQGRAVPSTALDDGTGRASPEGTTSVDVEFAVVETTTWLLSPAVFGDANEGLIFIGVAGDRNLLGSGLQGLASVQWSALRFLFDASLTEPRLFGTRSSATWEAHRRELRYRDFSIASVLGTSVRANYAHDLKVRFGGPARWFVGGGVGVEYGGVVFDDDKPLPRSSLLPQDTFRNTIEARMGFDSREGGLSPRNGLLVSFDASTAGPWTASGLAFVDGQVNVRAFWSPLWDITFKSNTQVGGILNPLGGQAPVTDRYFLGGLGSVRGFFPRSIGPRQELAVGRDVIAVEVGGVLKVVQNVEVEAPLWPGTPFRGFAFVDVGNAFGEDEIDAWLVGSVDRETTFLPLGLMMSAGFGVLLETPVLPFRFEWSVPLTRRSVDQPINFFLGVGSAF